MYKLIKQGSIFLAVTLVFSSILGLVWSLVPIFGKTLPHHLEAGAGISFRMAALLVSVLLGLMMVMAMALIGLVQTAEAGQDGIG
ncbi:hypothetical protein P4E94_17655 [Pontiellaceae bacterium B12219]|nr:hypothetical protein [Pontiellaceae bacterium B12219]